MKIEEVRKLSPWNRFLYWIQERHQIYLKRKKGVAKPWTDDEILQSYFFTNPYRENDKVTVWFRENVREPLRNDPRVLMATIIFRWFNLPETGELLMGGEMDPSYMSDNLLTDWDADTCLQRLREVRDAGSKVFTGAFMINSPPGKPKLEAIVERIDKVWTAYQRDEFGPILRDRDHNTMEEVHELLTRYDGLGGFMAYEVVCDLRYTYLLEHAPDKLTWCNPGPGCVRGLYRLDGEDFEKGNNSSSPPRPKDWRDRMQSILKRTQKALRHLPPLEMREIEHSLCEYDKYCRALEGDGKMKRTYNGK